jgi:ring-1,2-phenylacetyl-CoA epoxidase subunit PaaB
VHVGSIHAPDAEMALILAKEQYGRRMACVNLWVVRAEDIHASDYADADMFKHATDKSYREAFGYKVSVKVKKSEVRGERSEVIDAKSESEVGRQASEVEAN